MRASKFGFLTTSFFEDCNLVYNILSGDFFAMDPAETTAVQEILTMVAATGHPPPLDLRLVDKLKTTGFLIEDGVDEREQLIKLYRDHKENARGLSLTVAPTIACNFRCVYCYQSRHSRRMDQGQIEATRRFVQDHLEPETSLAVTWFGGEPLLAFQTIRTLADGFAALCTQRRCSFTQCMITNGYLLDERCEELLVAQGNVSYLQVTLDGPEPEHDKRRPARSGAGTYRRILNNVTRASRRLPIVIRVNIDRTNLNSLEALVEDLVARGLEGRIKVYLGHVLPYTEACSEAARTALTDEEFAATDIAFKLFLIQKGFRGVASLPRRRLGCVCVADNPDSHVLTPDGLVFKCWNEVGLSAAAASGRIDGRPDASMAANRRAWESYNPFNQAACRDCRFLPLCLGKCPWLVRRQQESETDHCTPYRFNLSDELRLFHFEQVVAAGLQKMSELNCEGVE